MLKRMDAKNLKMCNWFSEQQFRINLHLVNQLLFRSDEQYKVRYMFHTHFPVSAGKQKSRPIFHKLTAPESVCDARVIASKYGSKLLFMANKSFQYFNRQSKNTARLLKIVYLFFRIHAGTIGTCVWLNTVMFLLHLFGNISC